MINILENFNDDSENSEPKKEILFAITTAKFYCLLLKYDGIYILICEKDDGTQYQKRFRSKEDLGYYISRKFLQEYGEIFI